MRADIWSWSSIKPEIGSSKNSNSDLKKIHGIDSAVFYQCVIFQNKTAKKTN
jgi:hypothetical protein